MCLRSKCDIVGGRLYRAPRVIELVHNTRFMARWGCLSLQTQEHKNSVWKTVTVPVAMRSSAVPQVVYKVRHARDATPG